MNLYLLMLWHLFESHSSGFPSMHGGHIWYYGKAQNAIFRILVAGIPRTSILANSSPYARGLSVMDAGRG